MIFFWGGAINDNNGLLKNNQSSSWNRQFMSIYPFLLGGGSSIMWWEPGSWQGGVEDNTGH